MITTFKTQVYLKKTLNTDTVWETVKQWRLDSKNTPDDIKKEIKQYTRAPDNMHFTSKNKGFIETKKISDSDGEYWALHFMEPHEKNNQWNTYIVLTRKNNKNILTFETTFDGTFIGRIGRNKPNYFGSYILPLIDSSPAHFSYKPHSTDNAEVKLHIESVMKGQKQVDMPLVYVSYPNKKINAEELAEKLACMALVYVEADKSFSFDLKEKTGGANAYNGAIGIYFGNRKAFYLRPDGDISTERIYAKIADITAVKPFSAGASWFDVVQKENALKQQSLAAENEKILKELEAQSDDFNAQIKNLKDLRENLEDKIVSKDNLIYNLKKELEKKDSELKEFVGGFDEENQRLRDENEKLKNQRDTYKNKLERKNEDDPGIDLHIPCGEKELFPNEIRDFLQALIYNALYKESLPENGRKKDVTDSIKKEIADWKFENSSAGTLYRHCEEQWAAAIKNNQSGKEIVKILEQYNFSGLNDGKHYKMTYYGDKRYTVTVPKTPGDHRSGKNTLSTLCRIPSETVFCFRAVKISRHMPIA